MAAILAALVHALAYSAYSVFYESFGVSPEDAGIDFQTVLSRDFLWITLVTVMAAGFVATVSIVGALLGLVSRTNPRYFALALAAVAGVPVAIFTILFLDGSSPMRIAMAIVTVVTVIGLSAWRNWWRQHLWLRATTSSLVVVLIAIGYMTSVLNPFVEHVILRRVAAVKEARALQGSVFQFAQPVVEPALLDRTAIPVDELGLSLTGRVMHLGTGKSVIFFDVEGGRVFRAPSSIAFSTFPIGDDWLVDASQPMERSVLGIPARLSEAIPVSYCMASLSLLVS